MTKSTPSSALSNVLRAQTHQVEVLSGTKLISSYGQLSIGAKIESVCDPTSEYALLRPKDLNLETLYSGLSLSIGDSLTVSPFLEGVAQITGFVDRQPLVSSLADVKCPWCGTQLESGVALTQLYCPNTTCRGRLVGRLYSFFGPWCDCLTPFSWNEIVEKVPSLHYIADIFTDPILTQIARILAFNDQANLEYGILRIKAMLQVCRNSTRYDTQLAICLYNLGIPGLRMSTYEQLINYTRSVNEPPFPFVLSALENADTLREHVGIPALEAAVIAREAGALRYGLFKLSDCFEEYQNDTTNLW